MPRRPKTEKRSEQLNVKLTPREFGWVQRRAASENLKPAIFGRRQVLSDRPVATTPDAAAGRFDTLLLAQLSRIGNNLNQIARQLHTLHLPTPESLPLLLDEIRSLLAKASGR